MARRTLTTLVRNEPSWSKMVMMVRIDCFACHTVPNTSFSSAGRSLLPMQ